MQPAPQHSLPRVLGPWIATAIIVGTVIGSGVFVKGRKVADNVPDFGPAMGVWVLGGLLALLGSLALAEVAVLFPRAGGNYVFLREGYGRGAGFLWGWVEFWIIRGASAAALATMFTNSFHDVLRQSLYPGQTVEVLTFWPRQLLTVSVLAGLAAVSIRGTFFSGGGAVRDHAAEGRVAPVHHRVAVRCIRSGFRADAPAEGVDTSARCGRRAGNQLEQVSGVAAVGVLWAYNGWMNIAPVAGEVKDPHRNIPFALLVGVFPAPHHRLYCGAQVAYYLVLPHDAIIAKDAKGELSQTPLATEFVSALVGPVGIVIASAIVMTSVLGALNGNILVGPRLLYATDQDRLAPVSFGRLHAQYQTPALAIAVMTGWSCLLVVGVGALTQYRMMPVIPSLRRTRFERAGGQVAVRHHDRLRDLRLGHVRNGGSGDDLYVPPAHPGDAREPPVQVLGLPGGAGTLCGDHGHRAGEHVPRPGSERKPLWGWALSPARRSCTPRLCFRGRKA